MSRRTRRDSQTQATLDITPTIDVVFLLLIFFVATLRLPIPEADIRTDLPEKDLVAEAGQSETDVEETTDTNIIRIVLRRIGGRTELLFNNQAMQGGFGRLDSTLGGMRALAKAAPDIQQKVILDAGREVPYDYVVRALIICAKHDFNDISFAMPPAGMPAI